MKIVLTELIVSQAKTVGIMFCAGILTELMWQAKKRLSAASDISMEKRISKAVSGHATGKRNSAARILRKCLAELIFWIFAATVVSMFLYYCSYGKITFHAAIGFAAGIAFWKWLSKYKLHG